MSTPSISFPLSLTGGSCHDKSATTSIPLCGDNFYHALHPFLLFSFVGLTDSLHDRTKLSFSLSLICILLSIRRLSFNVCLSVCQFFLLSLFCHSCQSCSFFISFGCLYTELQPFFLFCLSGCLFSFSICLSLFCQSVSDFFLAFILLQPVFL